MHSSRARTLPIKRFACSVAALLLVIVMGLAGCADPPLSDPAASVGPQPTLAPVSQTLIPTVNIAKAVGRPAASRKPRRGWQCRPLPAA